MQVGLNQHTGVSMPYHHPNDPITLKLRPLSIHVLGPSHRLSISSKCRMFAFTK